MPMIPCALKNGRPIPEKGRPNVSMRTYLVLKLRRSEFTAGSRLNGFFSRFGIYCIAFDDDFTNFWNFNLYTR